MNNISRSLVIAALLSTSTACVSMGLPAPLVDDTGTHAPVTATTFGRLGLKVETLVAGLDTPWDLVWGPDNFIWATERRGRVLRIDPSTGSMTEVGNLDPLERGESGLMGLALHPDFEAEPFVFLAESYNNGGSVANRLLRARYDGTRLVDITVLVSKIEGNSYHDGSRLAFGPDGFLYMTTGDAGHSYLAQDLDSLSGKILRVDTDGNPASANPFHSFVYSYGHRNPQGLVFQPESGRLFITEHGPSDNDEVSIIVAGGNYGWPDVHGFVDNDVSGESAFNRDTPTVEPIAAWTPTIAPAGADFYRPGSGEHAIAGWDGSFLFVTLKGSALVRLTLSPDGTKVVAQQTISEGAYGRLRDVLVGPDGTIYLATSNRDGRGRPSPEDDRILVVRP